MPQTKEIFQRTELLLGQSVMETIARQRVIVFGVGGVGSWCVESLVRSGIRRLTIVDCDLVCPSNINRQLMATTKTVGRAKVEVLRERLLEINPEAEITALQKIYTAETAGEFHLEEYDYVIDAIDSLEHKCHLILHACQSPARLFSSMGAALKMDPTAIRVDEFWKVTGCPLARAIRNRFRRSKTFPSRKFKCVFSSELLPNVGQADAGASESPSRREQEAMLAQAGTKRPNGTVAHITAIFGFTLAGLVIQDIQLRASEPPKEQA